MPDDPHTPLVDLRAPGALLQYAADLARAHAGALTHQPVKVVAIPGRHLRLVKDSAPGPPDPLTGAECGVPLFRGRSGTDVCGYARVSHEDLTTLSAYRWTRASHGYARRSDGHGRQIYMHRQILGTAAEGAEVDHINGDKLDNRRSNLRPVSHAENLANRVGQHARNTSGYRGVYRRGSRWRANIAVGGKTRFLGSFATPGEAAAAVERALAADRMSSPKAGA